MGQLASFTVEDEWHMVMNYCWHCTGRGQPKSPETNLSEYYFVYHKLPWLGLGSKSGLRADRPTTSLLIHGTAVNRGK